MTPLVKGREIKALVSLIRLTLVMQARVTGKCLEGVYSMFPQETGEGMIHCFLTNREQES